MFFTARARSAGKPVSGSLTVQRLTRPLAAAIASAARGAGGLKPLAVLCLVGALVGGLLVPAIASAQATPPPMSSLIVKLVPALTPAQQAAVIARNGGIEVSTIPALRLHVISIPTTDLAATLASYQADPQVQSAEENKTRQSETMPTDPLYADQWYLPQVKWDLAFGTVAPTGVATVAILDTGIDNSHPDLGSNVLPGTSILDGSNGLSDPNGHGTWMAGIVAAQTNTTAPEGIAGIAYAGVRMLPVTVLDSNGLGQDSDVIAGVIWAADHGADVILMGFSNPGFSPNLQDAIDYAWSKGVILVAATGNGGANTPTFPAGDRGVMGVSATDAADSLAGFSNYGQAAFLAAPGTNIQTTDLGGSYSVISGTSASSAVVAGVAAFLKAVNPALTNGIIVGRIARTADPAGTQEQTGNGRVNMARALADTGTDFIEPAGADPVGAGGPFVGPYVAAATITSVTIQIRDSTCTTATGTFGIGQTACAHTTVVVGGGGNADFRIQWYSGALTGTPVKDTLFNNKTAATYVIDDTQSATVAGTWTVLVCKTGNAGSCAPGNQQGNTTFTVAAPTKLAFTTAPFTAVVGQCSPAITVQSQNAGGNPSNVTSATPVNLSTTSSGANGGVFYSNTACTTSITTATIPASGNSTPNFFYKDGTAGTPTVTAAATGLTSATQAETINKANTTTTITGDTPDPSVVGQPVTVTYAVTAASPGSGTPTGNVTVTDGTATCTDTVAAGSCQWTATSKGAKTLTATYAGDSNFITSTSTGIPHTVNNSTPTVAANSGSVTVNEGSTANNSGTYNDIDIGDNVTTTASVGTVTKTGTNSGTWSWSFNTTDGPAQSQTVTITANDGAGGISTTTFSLTVNNVAPVVTAAANQAANEGASTSFSLGSFTDPGADNPWPVDVNWGDASAHSTFNLAAAGPLGSQSHTYADNGSYTVTVTVTDKDGASDSKTFTVTVSNVAPTVTAPANQTANEGASTSFSLGSFTDPGANDSPWAVDVDWGDSSTHTTFSVTTTGSLGSKPHTYTDNGIYTVTVKVTDKDGGFGTATFQVVASDVAPTVSANSASVAVNEGQTAINSGTYSDPGVLDNVTITASVGTVTKTGTNSGTWSWSFATTDGPAESQIVTITANDGQGGISTTTFSLTVNNVAPLVTLAGDNTANEGDTKSYSYTVLDPGGSADAPYARLSQSCGANGLLSNDTFNPATGSGAFDCTFPDGPAASDVAVQVADKDAAPSNTHTLTVTIGDVAPTVTLSGPAAASEGQTLGYSFTVTDPGQDTFSLVSGSPTCGTGGTLTNLAFDSNTGTGSFDCTFPDGPATTDVSVQVQDSDTVVSNVSAITVTVANVPPTVTLVGPSSANEGDTLSYTFTTSDPGQDTFSVVTQSCGTGGTLSNAAFSALTGTGSFDCTFPDGPATTTVSVQVKDSDNANSNVSSVTVTIANVAPTVTLVGPSSANEGDTLSYTFTTSDPGTLDTFTLAASSPTCGTGGTISNSLFNTSTGTGSFDCTFPDGPATTDVSVQVVDNNGAASNTHTLTVTIGDVAPTVVLSGPAAASEGQTLGYSFTATDPGQDTFSLVSGSPTCGTGGTLTNLAFDSNTGTGSFDCTFPDGPATTDVSVQVQDSDTVVSNVSAITVTVANVPPTVTLVGPSSANEGDTLSYTFTTSDPGQDTFSVVTQSCGTGGTLSNAAFSALTGTGSFDCTFPDGPASSTVSVQVADSDNANSNVSSVGVTIANVAPTVTLAGDNTAAEGETKTYTFTVSDPGGSADAPYARLSQSCGANGLLSNDTFNPATGSGAFDCTFPDGPAASDVAVQVADKDAAPSNISTITVTIGDVAPTVTLSGANSTNEGETKHYTFTVTDPGTDTFTLVSTACGVNGSAPFNILFDGSTGAGAFDCTFPDGPAASDVAVQVADSDGANSNIDAITVTISNVAPTVTLAGPTAANEGDTLSYTFSTSDPGQDTFSVVTQSCGTGGTLSNAAFSALTGAGSFDCTFPDGPASSTVSVQVADSDNANSNVSSVGVTIANVAPTVTLSAGNTLTVDEGSTHTYSFTISDPGQDGVTSVAVSCGANGVQVGTTAFTTNGTGQNSGSFQCEFPDGPTTSIVTVSATDSDGDTGNTDTQTVTIGDVAPTVTLDPANTLIVNEGSLHTYNFTITDPGQDSVSAVAVSCGVNGAQVGTTAFTTNGTGQNSGSFDCTFPDGPASSIVTAAATDSDGQTGAADSQTVTVNNVAPTVTLLATNDLTVDEGTTHTYSFTISDPGRDGVTAVTVTCGANGTQIGTATFTNNGNGQNTGSFQCAFPDGPASSIVSASATDSDGDTGNTATQTVTVNNVAPTVTLSGPAASDEGLTQHYTFTTTDPGQDTFSLVSTTCGAAGSAPFNILFDANTGAGSFDCTFPDGPDSSTVAVQVADSDGANSNTSTITVSIGDVAPTVTLVGANSATEGETKHYTFSVTDPGADTFTLVSTSCGAAGSTPFNVLFDGTTGAGSFDCTFPDGPASSDVSVQVADSDGANSNTDTITVVVANVAPAVTLSGPSAADEGQTQHYTFTTSDPGQDTFSFASGSPSCGTGGTLSNATISPVTGTGSFDCSFPDGPASPTVAVQVQDSDGANSNVSAIAVTVNNVAPTVAFTSGDTTANESSVTQHTYSYSISDPGQDGVNGVNTSCGANGIKVTGSDTSTNNDNGQNSGSFQCIFPDGSAGATSDVTVSATDSDGQTGNPATRTVAIADVAPAVSTPTVSPEPSVISFAATAQATFSDPAGNLDSYTCTVNYGDGSGALPGAVSGNTCTGPAHTYTALGTYTVTVSVTDSDGLTGSSSTTHTVLPADLTAYGVATDSDLKKMDDFDIVFSDGKTKPMVNVSSTNPGTLHHRLTLVNATGVEIDAAEGNTATAIITIPAMTTCGNVPCPPSLVPSMSDPAFVLKGDKPVHVHPDEDESNETNATVSYKVSGDCAVSTGYSPTLPVNGVARCIKVTGFPIPRNHKATIRTHLEFRLKGTDGWDANSQYGFYSPFEFKSTTTVTYAVGPTIRSANQTVGVVGVGKKITAVGGFVFNSSGNPPAAGYNVRLYNTAAAATCGASPAPVAEDVVHPDGFYFIWRTGSDQSYQASATLLPSGVQYTVLLCNGSSGPVATQMLPNKLNNQEFNEVDFALP